MAWKMTDQSLLSTFERVVQNWPAGRAILSARRDQFDTNHGLFYSPIRYDEAAFERPHSNVPGESWIRSAFSTFVRDEFGAGTSTPIMSPNSSRGTPVDLKQISMQIRDQLEQRLVYAGGVEEVIGPISGLDPVPRVYALVCSDYFGNALNRKHLSIDQFRTSMSNMRVGFRLVLLGLPFRDQNPLRVHNRPEQVTLAEALFLTRLHCTALAVYQALPTGADIVVLSDGSLYAPILGVDVDAADRYVDGVRRLRDDLNMRGTVSIVELRHLISLYDAGTGIFAGCCDEISDLLLHLRSRREDPEFDRLFNSVVVGMRWNYNTKSAGVQSADIAHWIASGQLDPLTKLPDSARMDAVAARYAAVNLALRWHNVVATMMPTAIRGTMHAKPGQVALPRVGSCFPWNGVATFEPDCGDFMKIEVHSLSEAARRNMALEPRMNDAGEVLFYERRR